jgi:hypothetical protein
VPPVQLQPHAPQGNLAKTGYPATSETVQIIPYLHPLRGFYFYSLLLILDYLHPRWGLERS